MSYRLLVALLVAPLMAPPISMAGLSAQQPLVEGLAESKVRVLIYEDLQCPDCADFRRMLDDKLLPRYALQVAFVHRDFPLAKHPWARKAAVAGRYFDQLKPELGLAFRRYIMAGIRETTLENFNDRVSKFARDNELEPGPALAALGDPRLASLVERDFQDGVARGVVHTPTVFINGKAFVEQFSFKEISEALDAALAGR
jgi:protein-disulfide isomerase